MADEIKTVTGSMFHTNYSKLERRYFCDDDCEQSGCPSHILTLEIHSTSGHGEVKRDGVNILEFGCNQAQSLWEMLDSLIKEG